MRCSACFRERQQAKFLPAGISAETPLCGGCAMDIDKAIGFLSSKGYGLMFNLEGRLYMLDLATGEAFPTQYSVLADLFGALSQLDAEAKPPLPPEPPEPEKAPGKAKE